MTDDKKKYTYADWLNGIIKTPDVHRLIIQERINRELGQDEPCISQKDYQKIKEAIKSTFFDAVELSVKNRYRDLMNRHKRSPYPDQFLNDLIQELENRFNDRDDSTRKTVLSGDYHSKGINGSEFKFVEKVKNDETNKRTSIVFSGWHPKKEIWVKNDVYLATVEWKLLQQLKELTENKGKNNSSSGYGLHQENEEWVKRKWSEIRENKPSDNQADIELIKLYRKEFNGMTISKSQIQRFTGRQ